MDGKRKQVAVYMTDREKEHIEAAMVIDRVSSFSNFVAASALVRADLLIPTS
tara:strand:+ start:421 stop:576 length:156 start_codon:yes stop_codon:yes gene_type:complete